MPSAVTLPLTPIPPLTVIAPVEFDVEVVVLVAVKVEVTKDVDTLMFFTLSVAIVLLNVKLFILT